MGKVGVFVSSIRSRRVSVGAITGGLCAIIVWGLWCAVRNSGQYLAPPIVDSPAIAAAKNEISGFQVSACDTQVNHRPLYSIGFQKLRADNGRIGIFNTALFKVVTIEGLKLSFFTYGQGSQVSRPPWSAIHSDPASPSQLNGSSLLARVCGVRQEMLDNLLGELKGTSTGCSLLIDVSNTAEVLVRDLDYAVYQDGSPWLVIRCHKARISRSSPLFELRGRVVITASDGARLESNYVNWDMERGRFTAPGEYVLHHGGKPVMGRGLSSDQQLCAAAEHLMDLMKGEGNG